MFSPGAALVTGGAQRIGRTISLALAGAGYAVAIHANRSGAQAEQLAAGIRRDGGHAAVVTGELTDQEAVAELVAQAAAALGPLTLLVNNASIFQDDEVGGLDAAVWDRQFAVNLRAPVFLAQQFAAQARADQD
jgi:NAD(P)-dependent dehydrogenase (short-subunit alcohol dehydrogenase family)